MNRQLPALLSDRICMKNLHSLSASIATAIILSFLHSVPCAIAQETIPDNPTTEAEKSVLVGEVVVSGVEGKLQEEVYKALRTQPGKTVTRLQLQEDINAIFATGYFADVRAIPEDTPLGVRVTFAVKPNPVLRSVQVQGNQVLPAKVVNDSFNQQYGSILNLRQLQEGINKLNKWYQDNGYVLAQVVESPRVAADGTVTLEVTEGVVEDIQVRFVNLDGEDKDAAGKPIRGQTQKYIITREMQLKPGVVFNRNSVQKDLQRVFGLGIFQDLKVSLNPGQDPRKVIVVVNATEGKSFSLAPSGGFSSSNGFFAAGSFQAKNWAGRNQKLGTEVQWSQRGLLFDANFTDPWIAGDQFRTSYTVNGFRRQTISRIFEGGDQEVELPNGDRPRIYRTGGGITFTRPLSKNPLEKSEWVATAGLQYQRISIRDADGKLSPKDELGNNLSFSGNGNDDLLTLPLGLIRDRRNDSLRPTQGSVLRLTTEQSIPIGEASILSNKLRGSYSFYLPTRLTRLTQGCRKANSTAQECPQAIAFNFQAGTVIGDLPFYEAFSLGGANSVRGYEEGNLGSARSFVQATAEYRFPVFSVVSGALFFDAATDLGTSNSVPGNPGGVRGKPGNGFGYGVGVRVQSPLGPIRLDYGLNDEGESRIQFGFGERF
jgi:outer membrane protein insertion porin family